MNITTLRLPHPERDGNAAWHRWRVAWMSHLLGHPHSGSHFTMPDADKKLLESRGFHTIAFPNGSCSIWFDGKEQSTLVVDGVSITFTTPE